MAEIKERVKRWREADHVSVAVGREGKDIPPFNGWTITYTAVQRQTDNDYWREQDPYLRRKKAQG